MNKLQKENIKYLRGEGLGYKTIAARLGVTANAVKSYCNRNGYNGIAKPSADTVCRQCGVPLERKPGSGQKKFCSDHCRSMWWSGHAYLYKHGDENKCVCAWCGCAFMGFQSKKRKYCGHPCYIKARFKKRKEVDYCGAYR